MAIVRPWATVRKMRIKYAKQLADCGDYEGANDVFTGIRDHDFRLKSREAYSYPSAEKLKYEINLNKFDDK